MKADDRTHPDAGDPTISVVIPCLNEADSLGTVLEQATAGCEASGVSWELVVADNGSTDDSREIAAAAGARVVDVARRGYGAALDSGIRAARGKYVIMGDADGSYDFRDIPKFLAALNAGADIAQGCRLPSGGGSIAPGAMPFLHRWLGNPVLTSLSRWWMHVPVHDVNCGLRGFDRKRIRELDLQCAGMEFAVEMLVRGTQAGYSVAEVPTRLSPDLRRSTKPHLRTFRDGWRTLRFLLLYSPRWLFLVPGAILMILGLAAALGGWLGVTVGPARLDVHTLLAGCAITMIGVQAILFAYLTKVYGVATGLLPSDRRLEQSFKVVNLERGLILGLLLGLAGLFLVGMATLEWFNAGLGDLDYATTMREVIPGVFLMLLGAQGLLFSWFFSILGIRRP